MRSCVQHREVVAVPALSTRLLSSSTTDRTEGARRLAAAETDVLAALAEVQDPILSEGVVQLGMVQELFVNLESEKQQSYFALLACCTPTLTADELALQFAL
jgi:Iron-sulfur cluster assembly protein